MSHVILLVDDEPNLLRSLSRALRNEPYDIYTARSAEESIHILKAHPVDVVVSDENMPGMNGTEFLGWIADKLPNIPRIMLTGQSSEQLKTRAYKEGNVFRFFTKPCDVDRLASAIRAALELKEEPRQVSAPNGA